MSYMQRQKALIGKIKFLNKLKEKERKMKENIFVEGLLVKNQQTRYGNIIKLGCNVDKLVEFLQGFKNERGYVNIDIMTAKSGKPYAVVNTYKKEEPETGVEQPEADVDDPLIDFNDEIPF